MRDYFIQLPQSVILELTYQCNHHCLFCYCPWYAPNSTYSKQRELNLQEWKEVVDRLYAEGVRSFSISGGEALLKDGMPELVEYIRDEGLKRGIDNEIVLISNARLMNESYLNLFKRCRVHLSMSLPGYETFQAHTGVDNADGVLYWFRKAKEMGVKTTVNITVTKKNYYELFRTIALALLSGASSVLLNRFLPGGRGLQYQDYLSLNREQLNGMLDITEEVLEYGKRYGYVGTEFPKCLIKDINKYQRLNIGTHCAAAKYFFVIDPAGQIRTCNHSPRIVGNVFDEDMIYDKEYWTLFAESLYKPAYCSNCVDMTSCDCGCREVAHILKGSPKEIDPCIE